MDSDRWQSRAATKIYSQTSFYQYHKDNFYDKLFFTLLTFVSIGSESDSTSEELELLVLAIGDLKLHQPLITSSP